MSHRKPSYPNLRLTNQMDSAALGLYVGAFLARCRAARRSGDPILDELGLHGLLRHGDDGRVRLLVTDDRARDRLAAVLDGARAGMITVCKSAVRCAALLESDPAWRAGAATAMICRSLRAVPAPALPPDLTLRPVRRVAGDAPGGVALTDAVAAARRAAPEIRESRALAEHLRSLPSEFALWAAVDHDGVVRATSGSAAFGAAATVIFVNTDPDWRRRGIARAMTAIALRAAEHAGAHQAGLDASRAGEALYLTLGFESATPITRFRSSV
jgi:GNAT superfamily N-acetyltransferase